MSKLRSVNTHFWSDTYVVDIDPIEKLLFLYLLTNEKTNMLGIYELHINRIAFDTGIDKDMVVKIFDRFQEAKKAKYLNGYVIMQKFLKHQSFNDNMKKSAVRIWNDLPENIRKDRFCEPIVKALKGFGKAFEPIAKIELEIETELESETVVASDEGDIPNASDIDTWESANRVAEYLLEAICDYDPTHKYSRNRPSVYGWAKDIDLALRRDNRTEDQLKFIIDAVFRHADRFPDLWDKWAMNIESGAKLREKFDKIKNQIKKSAGNSHESKKRDTEEFLKRHYTQPNR